MYSVAHSVDSLASHTIAHDLTGASSRADWAVSGPFLVKVDFPAISYLATWSKKVVTTQKKSAQIEYTKSHFFRA